MNMQLPTHVAIIMDGNGRWAKKRNKKRIFGHAAGKKAMDNIVKIAAQSNIKYLSLFAFSTENWNRPKSEVNFLMKLLANSINGKTIKNLNQNNIVFRWTGFKQNLSPNIINKLLWLQSKTSTNNGMTFNLCFNYGGMQDVFQASLKVNKKTSIKDFSKLLLTKDIPAVDLLIRTGNEERISNFLIWQSAYAEIVFEKTMWPDYSSFTFRKNLIEFNRRHRRYGTINE